MKESECHILLGGDSAAVANQYLLNDTQKRLLLDAFLRPIEPRPEILHAKPKCQSLDHSCSFRRWLVLARK